MCDFVVSFVFEGITFSHQCNITIANEEDLRLLSAEIKYEDETRGVWDGKERKLIRSEPLPRSTLSHRHVAVETDYVESLGNYPVPQDLQSDIDGHDRFSAFDPWLKRDTYRDRLHSLLWIEEAAEVKAMRRFDLASVQFEVRAEPIFLGGNYVNLGALHTLTAEGLAERRPSVLPNDRLIAWEASGETDVEFEGWVAHTTATQIKVRFDRSFPSDRIFHVRFEFERMTMRCMHRAVDRCRIDVLWPDPDASKGPGVNLAGEAMQPDLGALGVELDDHQKAAIREICGRRGQLLAGAKQAPFLLRGSFGCGKTHTLLQSVRAVLQVDTSAHVLICSDSNNVADMICCLLATSFLPAQMLRFNAFTRSINTLQGNVEVLKGYCHWQDASHQAFGAPSLDTLLTYRVLVSTAAAAATLFGMGVGQAHFTHIFLDECAQMMEPSALIPLCLAGRQTAVVLCGDELQVGPTVRSPSAKHHGLHESLMERLAGGLTARLSTHRELYRLECGKAAGPLTRRLLSNYRSHPRLLALPSALFYGGTLQAVGQGPAISSLCSWQGLPTPGFPFMFVGVEGQDERDTDNPSYYNNFEAMEIKMRVTLLVKEKGLAPSDIVIIAPYKSQIARIRRLLRENGLGDVSVGTPGVIQGREAKAVFVSTVRAMGSKHMDVDSVCNLGLLHDPRLINTVLTRAVALCVIVGDPRLLARHNIWGRVLQ
jgi:helicase MOV-10